MKSENTRMDMWKAGMNDGQIAKAEGVGRKTICDWRKVRKLAPNAAPFGKKIESKPFVAIDEPATADGLVPRMRPRDPEAVAAAPIGVSAAPVAAGEAGVAVVELAHGVAAAGYRGRAVASGELGIAVAGMDGTAVGGTFGTAVVDEGGTATVGAGGMAFAGEGGQVSGGHGALLVLFVRRDGNRFVTSRRVGEDGTLPNTPYRAYVDENDDIIWHTEVSNG